MNLQESIDLTLKVPIAILLSYGGFDLCELVKIYHSHKRNFLMGSKEKNETGNNSSKCMTLPEVLRTCLRRVTV